MRHDNVSVPITLSFFFLSLFKKNIFSKKKKRPETSLCNSRFFQFPLLPSRVLYLVQQYFMDTYSWTPLHSTSTFQYFNIAGLQQYFNTSFFFLFFFFWVKTSILHIRLDSTILSLCCLFILFSCVSLVIQLLLSI